MLSDTVTCLLCRGTINYKLKNPALFRAHMKDQHNAFFRVDYVLASCFMEEQHLNGVESRLREQEEQELELRETEEEEQEQELDVEKQEVVSLLEEVRGQVKREAEVQEVESSSGKKRRNAFGGDYKCDQCGHTYSTNGNLTVHRKKVHGAMPGIKQEIMEADNITIESLDNTEESINEGSGFEGSLAEEDFVMDESVENEFKTDGVPKYGSQQENYTCDQCPKIFKTVGMLNNHKNRKHTGREGTEVCDLCPKTFATKQGLRYHMKHNSHTDVCNFPCDVCPEKFYRRQDFKLHKINSHHLDQTVQDVENEECDISNFSCGLCPEKYNREQDWKMHLVNKHMPKKTDKDEENEGSENENDTTTFNEESPIQNDPDHISTDVANDYVCAFGCGETFSSAKKGGWHEIKAHGRPAKTNKRRHKSNMFSTSEENNDQDFVEGQAEETTDDKEDDIPDDDLERMVEKEESSLRSAELEALKAKYDNTPQEAPAPDGALIASNTMAFLESLQLGEEPGVTGLEEQVFEEKLQETRDLGVEEQQPVFPPGEGQQQESSSSRRGLDLTQSSYFTKFPKAIANPQERSVRLFNQPAEGLPEGWKVRTIQDPKEPTKVVRHYLSPDTRVLKTGLGVVEYLRLEGSVARGEVWRMAREVLGLPEKKINSLYV